MSMPVSCALIPVSAAAAYVLGRFLVRHHNRRPARDRVQGLAGFSRHEAEAAGDGKPLTVRETVTLGVLDYMAVHGPDAGEPTPKTGGER